MSQVEFQEGGENFGNPTPNKSVLYSRFQASSDLPRMVRWLLDKGIVKTQAQANMVLFGIMCFFIVATLVTIFKYVL